MEELRETQCQEEQAGAGPSLCPKGHADQTEEAFLPRARNAQRWAGSELRPQLQREAKHIEVVGRVQ